MSGVQVSSSNSPSLTLESVLEQQRPSSALSFFDQDKKLSSTTKNPNIITSDIIKSWPIHDGKALSAILSNLDMSHFGFGGAWTTSKVYGSESCRLPEKSLSEISTLKIPITKRKLTENTPNIRIRRSSDDDDDRYDPVYSTSSATTAGLSKRKPKPISFQHLSPLDSSSASHRHRHQTVSSSSASSPRSPYKGRHGDHPICASCHTDKTPYWRDSWNQGFILCNACGLRYSKFKRKCSLCNYVPRKEDKHLRICPQCNGSWD